jgi:hypothetical protein
MAARILAGQDGWGAGAGAAAAAGALSQKTDELEGRHTVEFQNGFSVGNPLIGLRTGGVPQLPSAQGSRGQQTTRHPQFSLKQKRCSKFQTSAFLKFFESERFESWESRERRECDDEEKT